MAGQSQEPLDYSFKELSTFDDLLQEEPRSGVRSTVALRVPNNQIKKLTHMKEVLEEILDKPSGLVWLDLAFNKLEEVDEVLAEYNELSVLYLHANNITKLRQIDALKKLPNLKSLTLHGNPIAETEGYRHYIVATLPNLCKLDFCAITKQDRALANSWLKMHPKRKR